MIRVRVKYWENDSFKDEYVKHTWEVRAVSVDQAVEFLEAIKEHSKLQKECDFADSMSEKLAIEDKAAKKSWWDKQFYFSGMRFGTDTKIIPWTWTSLISAKVVIGFET